MAGMRGVREGGRAAYRAMTRLAALPSVALVLGLPFVVDAVGTRTSKVNALAMAMVLVPLLALQASTMNVALETLTSKAGGATPRLTRMRRQQYGTAMLISVAAVMQSIVVILAVRTGYLPDAAPADRGFGFNAALIVAAVVVLIGRFELLKRLTLLVGVAVVVALGRLGLVDAVKIALWETLFVTLLLLQAMRTITTENLALGEWMLAGAGDAEGEAPDGPGDGAADGGTPGA